MKPSPLSAAPFVGLNAKTFPAMPTTFYVSENNMAGVERAFRRREGLDGIRLGQICRSKEDEAALMAEYPGKSVRVYAADVAEE